MGEGVALSTRHGEKAVLAKLGFCTESWGQYPYFGIILVICVCVCVCVFWGRGWGGGGGGGCIRPITSEEKKVVLAKL